MTDVHVKVADGVREVSVEVNGSPSTYWHRHSPNRLGFTTTWDTDCARPREFWNDRARLLVANRKLPATAYIYDQGLRFESWEQTLAALDVP
ncbi:hypothetical protein ACIQPQ_31100 [Streptomyces sp. NPDC091281]|uniref:hypothetical protein n=1 Tax=Streptomyces sp. NPDC091281 TaxID=3365985 RepID=UPI0038200393